ncbi:hypothetical protein DSECCO2_367970 [anaerobic digester metagenome]
MDVKRSNYELLAIDDKSKQETIEYVKHSLDKELERIKENDHFDFDMVVYLYGNEMSREDGKIIVENHLKEFYYDNPEYKDWKITRRGLEIEMKSKGYIKKLEYQQKEKRRLNYLEEIKLKGDLIEKLDDEISRKKSKHYKGLFNLLDGGSHPIRMRLDPSILYIDERVYEALCHIRDDFVCVNERQYKIIYDKKISEDNCKENRENTVEYTIDPDDPFFSWDDGFFNKKSEAIKGFLTESEKVAISPDMMLIPFYCKGDFYYITIDNFSKHMSIDSVKTAFKHINKQSNLYYQIYGAITKELRDNYNEFEHHLLRGLRKATGINKRILTEFYPEHPERLLTSKHFYTVE